MFLRIVRRLRHNALAIVALVFAIGSTSYAAIQLPAGSVGTRQLRTGAVTLSKINSAAQQSLQGNTGPAGPEGARGATGAQGPQGALGPHGLQGGLGPQGVSGVEHVVVRYGATVVVPKAGPIVRDGYAYCLSGEKVVGGGAKLSDDPSDPPASGTSAVWNTYTEDSGPVTSTSTPVPTNGATPIGWHYAVINDSATHANRNDIINPYVLCAS
jgi:hypothetical protein